MLGFQRISLTLGAVCRQAGHRFGDHVERVVPLVLKYAQVEDDELREHCLQACENMVYKCGKEITPHIPTIQKMCLVSFIFQKKYIRFTRHAQNMIPLLENLIAIWRAVVAKNKCNSCKEESQFIGSVLQH